MVSWRIPRWVLPAALGGVLAITAADAVLLRRHRVFPLPGAIPEKTGQAGAARATVEARPSPFEHVEPEIVVTQTLPPPVVAPIPPAPQVPAAAEPPRDSRLSRMISRIPLLRRLGKHPQSDGTEPR